MNLVESILQKFSGLNFIELVFQKSPFLRHSYYAGLERIFERFPNEGFKVMDEEWDYLIVLDGCRFDYFRKFNNIPGELKKKISLGSDTGNWKERNFKKNYPDTVYVTANPQLSKYKLKENLGFIPFLHVEEVWDYGWNDYWDTVLPEEVTKAALKVKKEFPDKRIVVHYDQPHMPFIAGPYAEELRKKRHNLDPDELWKRILQGKRLTGVRDTWRFVSRGMIDFEKAKKGYEENVKFVLSEIKELIEGLEGKIVVTADHGDAHGEYYIFGHPGHVYLSPLVEVPWLEVNRDKLIEKGDF